MSFNVVDTPSLAFAMKQHIQFNQHSPGVLDEHTDIDLIDTERADLALLLELRVHSVMAQQLHQTD